MIVHLCNAKVKGLMIYMDKEEKMAGDTRTQIKFVIERMLKKFDYDELMKHVPDENKAFVKNIYKSLKRKTSKKDKKEKNRDKVFITEGDEEPIDLADPTSLNKMTTQKPKKDEEMSDDEVKINKKGKIVVKEKENKKKRPREEERAKDYDSRKKKQKSNKKRKLDNKHAQRMGQEYRAKPGTGGDVKRKGKPDPYGKRKQLIQSNHSIAYIPMDPSMLNKRNKTKPSNIHVFENMTKAARKGAQQARKKKKK
jgi:hypothetical protein